ncbi:MAG: hypothetical protein RI907_3424, partial [Pseudomonadota bacterium]
MVSRVLQYIIAGHHAGLDNWDNHALAARLASNDAMNELEDALGAHPPAEVLMPDQPLPA